MVQINLFKTEIQLQMLKKNLWLPRGKGGGQVKLGDWDRHIYTTVYKIDN